MITFKEVFTEENFVKQFDIATRGKSFHTKIIRWREDELYRIGNLRKDVISHTYIPPKDHIFSITEPKLRIVRANGLESKIIQGILVTHVIIPCVEKSLIYDNYASRKGLGTKMALTRCNSFIHTAYINCGNSISNMYVLKCDIRKYFDNISLDILFNMIDRLPIDKHLKEIIKLETRPAFPDTNKGLCLGHELAQWFSIWYLNEMDHFIKENLHIKYYGRYMDDFYLISDSYEYLEYCNHEIENHLNTLGLELNQKKTYIKCFNDNRNFTFLGFNFKITESGKAKMILTDTSVKRVTKRINSFKRYFDKTSMTDLEEYNFIMSCIESLASWKSHAVQGSNPGVIYQIDHHFYNKFYNELQKFEIDYKDYCYINGMYEYKENDIGHRIPKKLNHNDKLWVNTLYSMSPVSYDIAKNIRLNGLYSS